MRRTLVITGLGVLLAFATPALAAQGITEVNPSGVHGTVVILQADEGEEVVRGDTATFVVPFSMQDTDPQVSVGDFVLLEATCNRGGYCRVISMSLEDLTTTPDEPARCVAEPSLDLRAVLRLTPKRRVLGARDPRVDSDNRS